MKFVIEVEQTAQRNAAQIRDCPRNRKPILDFRLWILDYLAL
ncbi:MAG: hypothetical protein AVDCRST_MAG74-2000 [uncultured Pyrinomonadaceae bacterium]|uniref:Uncharacterized protein n=1 Tax=uncultured Pyrinomonadaceae bacterium TaxID=2283094 RepID=A0A6J4NY47_9BACT|nr:MAG: hypothetical protein AVDCRST_MAG74-2000 [uncultured Pyrinomonadaceae bacterium]